MTSQGTSPSVQWTPDLEQACLDVFLDLLRIDTSNPPGREHEAIRFIGKLLEQEGIAYNLLAKDPARPNLIATLPGGNERPLMLLSHVDVVAANPDEWTFEPFGGIIHDGVIWGRGTLDTKQLTAMEICALIALKRQGVPLKRDCLLMVTVDEEQGSRLGLEYLVQSHRQVIPDALVLSEGGGFGVRHRDRHYMVCTAGEKSSCSVTVRASELPEQSAGEVLADALMRLTELGVPVERTGVGDAFLNALGIPGGEDGVLPDTLPDAQDPFLDFLYTYVLKDEIQVLRIDAMESEAVAAVELRLLPHHGPGRAEALLHQALDGTGVAWAIEAFHQGYESALEANWFDLLQRNVTRFGSDASVLPIYALGKTDGRFIGPAGLDVYGCSPLLPDASFGDVIRLVHAPDERVSVSSYLFGVKVLTETVLAFCSA